MRRVLIAHHPLIARILFWDRFVLGMARVGQNFFNGSPEQTTNRRARRMPLHQRNQLTVEWRLKLVFADFFNTVDHASPISGVEYDLGVNPTEPEIGDDIGFREPDRELPELCFGSDGLAMTGNDSRTLRHRTHPTLQTN